MSNVISPTPGTLVFNACPNSYAVAWFVISLNTLKKEGFLLKLRADGSFTIERSCECGCEFYNTHVFITPKSALK